MIDAATTATATATTTTTATTTAPTGSTPSLLADTARRHLAQTCTAQLRIATPLGALLLARSAHGLAGAWFDGQKHHPGEMTLPPTDDDPLLRQAADWLRAYFMGRAPPFDLPLDPAGTTFQRSVWQALIAIPSGATRSYRDIAETLGAPAALRAIGGAIGRNPLSVIVPCHRVIGSDGSLTGYAGGVERKRALLALESARAPARTTTGEADDESRTLRLADHAAPSGC